MVFQSFLVFLSFLSLTFSFPLILPFLYLFISFLSFSSFTFFLSNIFSSSCYLFFLCPSIFLLSFAPFFFSFFLSFSPLFLSSFPSSFLPLFLTFSFPFHCVLSRESRWLSGELFKGNWLHFPLLPETSCLILPAVCTVTLPPYLGKPTPRTQLLRTAIYCPRCSEV